MNIAAAAQTSPLQRARHYTEVCALVERLEEGLHDKNSHNIAMRITRTHTLRMSERTVNLFIKEHVLKQVRALGEWLTCLPIMMKSWTRLIY